MANPTTPAFSIMKYFAIVLVALQTFIAVYLQRDDKDFQDISMVKLLVTNFFLFTLPLGLLQAIFMGIYFGSPLITFIPGGIATIISTAISLFKHLVGKYIIWFQALLPMWLIILPIFYFPIWSFINYKLVTLVLQII